MTAAVKHKRTINGHAVPEKLTAEQIRVMFPRGLLGLVNEVGIPIFPSASGELHLPSEGAYSIPESPQKNAEVTSLKDPLSPLSVIQLNEHVSVSDQEGIRYSNGKVFGDRIHDYITIPPLLVAFIDTPEFQRLRGLKQLGSTHYLYPGATHTRFEHSIGVAFLAGVMVRHIRKNQPELDLNYRDEMCVMLAGLCHDLGHGPFSHLFEEFVNRSRAKKWRHEEMSVKVFNYIIQKHSINFEEFCLLEEDKFFVANLIKGTTPGTRWKMGTRPETKRFLFDIVSNKRNGIDVDKLDYFMRDSACCWGRVAVDCHINRIIKASRVIYFDKEWQICFEEKMALSLGDIFGLRAKLHKYVYQHRIVNVIDHMIMNALELAGKHFTILGTDGKPYALSECVEDIEAFVRLGDWVLDAIEASPNAELERAQSIVRRIRARDFYHLAGVATYRTGETPISEKEIANHILRCIPPQASAITVEEIVVQVVHITYGSSDQLGTADDPVNHVGFFNPKKDPNGAFHLSPKRKSPLFTPTAFEEWSILVYCKSHESLLSITIAFEAWKQENSELFATPVPTMNFTPTQKRKTDKRETAVSTSVNEVFSSSQSA
ncbi:dendritic cell-derived IFNG-induced protein [Perkinsela sp. CCAP 1560/4]|nr:dendritic cell-derived IFNG-induced protein [Perkinsela sp. CCAP 1560/4]|eukprot:KNH04070.1 dendritic cell-derived IFNG-induced protein [Perkinsela sp. CCAP 1560/4]